MKLRIVLLAIVLGAVSLAPRAVAQDEKIPQKPATARFGDPTGIGRMYEGNVYGVIKEVNQKEIILTKTAAGADQAVKLLKKTKFVQDGKPSTLDKFKVGDEVYVDVDKNKKTGELSAKRITGGVASVQVP